MNLTDIRYTPGSPCDRKNCAGGICADCREMIDYLVSIGFDPLVIIKILSDEDVDPPKGGAA